MDQAGANWIPYQEANIVTLPFGEYTSGHSAFSGAACEVFRRFAGTEKFKTTLTVTIAAGKSTIEPGLVPQAATTLSFTGFRAAADRAGLSRRYGGIHFESGDLNGRSLGTPDRRQRLGQGPDLLQRHRQLTTPVRCSWPRA